MSAFIYSPQHIKIIITTFQQFVIKERTYQYGRFCFAKHFITAVTSSKKYVSAKFNSWSTLLEPSLTDWRESHLKYTTQTIIKANDSKWRPFLFLAHIAQASFPISHLTRITLQSVAPLLRSFHRMFHRDHNKIMTSVAVVHMLVSSSLGRLQSYPCQVSKVIASSALRHWTT